MARTRPENAQREYPQSCPKMDATREKEARTTKDNMAKDSNGRAPRYGALVGRGSGRRDRNLWRNNEIVALRPTGDEEDK